MNTYRPVFNRPPNKLQHYEMESFTDRSGHTGKTRIAVYDDKNGKTQRMIAQVIWDKS